MPPRKEVGEGPIPRHLWPVEPPVSPGTREARRQARRDLMEGRKMRKIKATMDFLIKQGETGLDALALMTDSEKRQEGKDLELVNRVAREMGIGPLPPGYVYISKLPPLEPYKLPAKTGPVRTDSKRQEKRVDFVQPKQNTRVRPPVSPPPPPRAKPPRTVEARLEALQLAPQEPEPSKSGLETREQQREFLVETLRQRHLAKKADRKRQWELGGRYGHPLFPRGRPYPSKGEEQRITVWEKRMQRHAERALRRRKGLEQIDQDESRGRNDRRSGSFSGRGNGSEDEPIHSPVRDYTPPPTPRPFPLDPPGPPGPPSDPSSSSPSPKSPVPPLPPSPSSSSSSNKTIHSLVPHIFPNLNRPEISGLPMEILLGIVELMHPSSRIRLALAIPRVFQSPSFINIFTLDAARQMRDFRAYEPPRRWHGGEPPENIPLLQTAIYRTYCDADVISRILDGYAAVAGDVINDIYMFRGFRPPLVAATYALRPDLLRVLFERGADPNIRWPFLFPSPGPTDRQRINRCTIFLESHRECQPPAGLRRTSRRFFPCPDLYAHALHVYDRRRAAAINPRRAPERGDTRLRDQMNRAEETVSIVLFQRGLHRFDQMTTYDIPPEINQLVERGLYGIIGDLADAMIRETQDNDPNRRQALNLLLERVAQSGNISEEDYEVENVLQGNIDESIHLENMDRRDNLLRRLVASGARIAPNDAPEIAQSNGNSMLVILRAIAQINPDENNEVFRALVDARVTEYEVEFITQLIHMIRGRRDDLARLLYAAIRDGAHELYNELIDTHSAGACRQALLIAIERNNVNLLDRLMRLPYNGNILGNGTPPNNGHALSVYPIAEDVYDRMDHIAVQGRSILEGALVMRNFDAALFLIDNGFPTTIDNNVMERVQRGLDELRGTIEPMTATALEEAGEPPLDSRRILPIYNGRPEDKEAQIRFRATVATFETVASRLKSASENVINKFNSLSMNDGLDVHMAIVGAGPRGTSVLERMCASVPDILLPDVHLTIHMIDPFPPGAGSVWRTDQPAQLIMNTITSQMTLYTDQSVTCSGPIRPGQDLYTWQMHATGEPRLGPNDCATRALYGHYLRWAFDQIQVHDKDKVNIVVHTARAVSLDDESDGRQVLTLSTGDSLSGLSAVVLAQGHLPLIPSPRQQQLTTYAEQNGLCYIPPAKPADVDLSPINPNQPVLLRGLGLSFFDYVSLLTEGRGGRFERTTSGYRYIPSGREPRIYAGSRRGIPYVARGDNQKPPFERHTPLVLTDEIIAMLREQAESGNPPDFQEEVWPLVAKEVETVYYETMLGANNPERLNFRAEFLSTQPGGAEEIRVLDKFNIPKADRWSWEFMSRPYDNEYAFTSAETWQNWLLHYLDEDVRQAALGNIESPQKAAIDVLRDLRNELRLVVNHGGISGTSRRDQFDSIFSSLNAHLSIGPPRIRIEQLIALIKANIVTVIGPELEVHSRNGVWLAKSPEIPGSRVRVTGLIEARVPEPSLKQTADELLRDLLDRGQCRPHTIGDYETGGVDVTPNPCHLINNNGVPHPRRFVVGVPTEGVHWVTAIGVRPGTNSVSLLETDAVARAALMASVNTTNNPRPKS
ncbi:FAD-NAD(P)-binding-domain-containing protein [Daldinia loculata]|uniref:FAD-NAD(P)-binding-domain-containing protein n=1 Tax=Daldinia loculata TaxID=103429 RepID=UPI0020C4C8FC|nr:FAD-NAD(P)-binding-domain-containing protein [Daldinia loculata]KAI1650157.1 FAD-NAD(P)-binding-domain-containing protein [Daldinia loculata]